MMELHTLIKTKSRSKKRLGQGHGSGKVKTGGKGTKGQKSRGSITFRLGVAGVSFAKRLPLYRGKYRNKSHAKKACAINIKFLAALPKNTVVDVASLVKYHIISASEAKGIRVKILGNGDVSVPLTVKVPISKSAAKKIEKVGGTIEKA
jgi:large subunit ribosomal protein L15